MINATFVVAAFPFLLGSLELFPFFASLCKSERNTSDHTHGVATPHNAGSGSAGRPARGHASGRPLSVNRISTHNGERETSVITHQVGEFNVTERNPLFTLG